MHVDVNKLQWIREPADYLITESRIEVITATYTDLL